MTSNSIALYAHKGGVGKSTIIFDIAYKLAQLNKDVVIIDADTQLNTTFKILERNGILINNTLIDSFVTQNTTGNDINVNGINYKTLYNYINGAAITFNMNHFYSVQNSNNKIKILLGSPILYNLEVQLINAINSPNNYPAIAHVPMLFYTLINQIKMAYNNNVVILVDMSPSSSTINQNILLSCDYFILPCNPDNNSMISLDLLFRYINTWRTQHSYLPINHIIKFLFVILNKYKVTNINGNGTTTMSHTAIHFNGEINNAITNFFLNIPINIQYNFFKYN